MSKHHVRDDQKKFNYALNSLELQFTTRSNINEPWGGKTPAIGNDQSTLNVTVIPMNKICRGKACTSAIVSDCYVWHQGGDHDIRAMRKNSIAAKLWILRDDWKSVDNESELTGTQWLKLLI